MQPIPKRLGCLWQEPAFRIAGSCLFHCTLIDYLRECARLVAKMSAEAATLIQQRITYRDYPEELKASIIAAIEANGGQFRPTARLFNIRYDTVHYWWTHSERFRQIQSPSAQNLADKIEQTAHNTIDSIAEHDLSVVSFADKTRSLGIMIDKMQLLRGLPTSITESVERQELTVILESALAAAIDVTPGPTTDSGSQS